MRNGGIEPMTEPESTWRIRSGVGLLADYPMSAERRAAFDKEAERERRAAELEAEQRRETALERRWDLQRQGIEPRSVGQVLASASVAQDRQDRRDAAAEERNAEQWGKRVTGRPTATTLLAAAKAERQARVAAEKAEPVPAGVLATFTEKIINEIHYITGKKPEL